VREIGRAESRALQSLELLVELGVAGGGGHRLPQLVELAFSAADAGGLGGGDRAVQAQAGVDMEGHHQ
jgi:hypothetical protein